MNRTNNYTATNEIRKILEKEFKEIPQSMIEDILPSMYLLKNSTLEISFPHAQEDENWKYIYQLTIEQIKEIEINDVLLHIDKDSHSIYNYEIDKFLSSFAQSELNYLNLNYPGARIFVNSKPFNSNTESVLAKIYNLSIFFRDSKDLTTSKIRKADLLNEANIPLSHLQILLKGDILIMKLKQK